MQVFCKRTQSFILWLYRKIPVPLYQTRKTIFNHIATKKRIENTTSRKVVLRSVEVFGSVVKHGRELLYISSRSRRCIKERKRRNGIVKIYVNGPFQRFSVNSTTYLPPKHPIYNSYVKQKNSKWPPYRRKDPLWSDIFWKASRSWFPKFKQLNWTIEQDELLISWTRWIINEFEKQPVNYRDTLASDVRPASRCASLQPLSHMFLISYLSQAKWNSCWSSPEEATWKRLELPHLVSTSTGMFLQTLMWRQTRLANKPFYSCLLGDLAFVWAARLGVTLLWYSPSAFAM